MLDAFGPGALMTRSKLDAINAAPAGRKNSALSRTVSRRSMSMPTARSSARAGPDVLVTTLDFALRNFLDVTSIIVGWGQSGEAGGKAHFAGVGFGGENATDSCARARLSRPWLRRR